MGNGLARARWGYREPGGMTKQGGGAGEPMDLRLSREELVQ